MSPDLAARLVILHSYLYYVANETIINDHEYERLVLIVVKGWKNVHPDRKWQLGSAKKIAASGSHIKYSVAAMAAAGTMWSKHYKRDFFQYMQKEYNWVPIRPQDFKTHKKTGIRYLTSKL